MDATQQLDHKLLPRNFADLYLRVGDSFSIETLTPAKRFPVKILGYMEHQSLIVTCPIVQGRPFMLKEDQLLKVRLMAGTVVCGFATKVLRVCRSPYLYMHLQYPEKIEAVEVRKASRVRVKLPTLLQEQEVGTLYGQWPKRGEISDLSRTGCGLIADQPVAAKGDRIIINALLEVDGERRKVAIPSLVRNVAEIDDDPQALRYQYGIEFQELAPQDRIWLSAYVYEQRIRQRVV